jgi:trans-AT polyketide synthase/acyltransferase/oxidoreductase domain-containing protein
MQGASDEFDAFVRGFDFQPLRFPVIANATAQPYPAGQTASLLVRQIRESVRWSESVRVLMGEAERRGEEFAFKELGDSAVLTRMVAEIRKLETPL